MKMNEEMAVRLHRMMWSDMQRELGDRPTGRERQKFKYDWIRTQFPGESIASDCWLCEYASSKANRGDGDPYCKHCPISWPNGHCNTLDYSYAKEPISDILALPAKNEKDADKYIAYDEKMVLDAYYRYREFLLEKASGIPASSAIEDHVKKIQEKAVEDYFEKTPGAKLATMDVDQAFKQYADEQKAPIFHDLAEASGLSAGNESVKAHISLIMNTAMQNGRVERSREVFRELAKTSGLPEGKWCISDHVKAIQVKASHEKDMELLRKTGMLNAYKDALSEASDLDRNRPVDDHIREIVKNSMEAGAAEERDRIQEKIYEVLLS